MVFVCAIMMSVCVACALLAWKWAAEARDAARGAVRNFAQSFEPAVPVAVDLRERVVADRSLAARRVVSVTRDDDPVHSRPTREVAVCPVSRPPPTPPIVVEPPPTSGPRVVPSDPEVDALLADFTAPVTRRPEETRPSVPAELPKQRKTLFFPATLASMPAVTPPSSDRPADVAIVDVDDDAVTAPGTTVWARPPGEHPSSIPDDDDERPTWEGRAYKG